MSKILVTGGAGYIGSHVCHLLIDQGHDVTCIDSLITGNRELLPKKVKLEVFDIAEKEKVTRLIKGNNFDLVIHFAGLIRVEESVEQPERYNDFNYSKAKIFLEACYNNGLKKVIFSSTASVYGAPKTQNVKETDSTNPLNPYASSKLQLENFIRKTSKRDELIINGDDYDTPDGTAIRDYIHISDLAEIHLISANHLINNGESNLFNCGYGNGFSIKDVINEFNKIIDNNLITSIGPRRSGDSAKIISSVEKFKNYFSWKPRFNDLNYILRTAINWEKKLKNK